jgi:D-alanyl-lipoteichoic acid acyltransferase DltB (MBOAT superfamily)
VDVLSWTYVVFFAVVFGLHWATRSTRSRQALIVLATCAWYVFGVWWHAIAAICMGTSTWIVGRWIASRPAERRGVPVVVGVVLPIVYFLLFRHFAEWFGYAPDDPDRPWWLPNPLLAPIGLSFIMFESIAFQLDLYFGKLERPGSWWSQMVFVLFFPTRVIGPMRKYQDFVSQLGRVAAPSPEMVASGLRRIGIGLLKKIVVANPLGTFALFNLRPEMIESGASVPLLLGGYVYWLYLYFDFSGYTDIAVGTSQLLGFKVPENFNHPYRARHVSEYWQRWHMSLSLWVREYIYTPLAIQWRYFALGPPAAACLSMIVLGLWHGIELHFLAFGLIHGLWLAAHMIYRQTLVRGKRMRRWTRSRPWTAVSWFLTMNLIVWTHIFYATNDFWLSVAWMRAVLG